MAKSPATLMPKPLKTPNHSSPPTPVPPKTTLSNSPIPKHRASPFMIPATLPPKALPPSKAAATTAVQRRPVPSTVLTSSMLRDYSDDEIDAELRHLGILFYGTTRRFENNTLALDHYNNVRGSLRKFTQNNKNTSKSKKYQ